MLSLLAQTAVSFVATVSFAILFQVPREQYVYSGLCGAAGWLCYLLVMQNYPSPAVASFAAVVVLTVMSRIFAVRRKTPGDRLFDLWHLPAGSRCRHLLHCL